MTKAVYILHVCLPESSALKVKCRQLCIHVSESSAGIFLDNYDKSCLHIICIFARVKCVYMIVKFIIMRVSQRFIITYWWSPLRKPPVAKHTGRVHVWHIVRNQSVVVGPPRPCNSMMDECHGIFSNKDREARAVEAHPSCWNKT